jgi:hypothetical protein
MFLRLFWLELPESKLAESLVTGLGVLGFRENIPMVLVFACLEFSGGSWGGGGEMFRCCCVGLRTPTTGPS